MEFFSCGNLRNKILAENVYEYLKNQKTFEEDISLVVSKLIEEKSKLKDESIIGKYLIWQKIVDNDGITLLDSVQDKRILVIDDLYQSGTTLWSFAKFLKSRGARSVYGFVCVKTRGDSDNR